MTADAGYSSGEALKFCEDHQIDVYIPNFGQYKPEREGFYYNSELDQYECVQTKGNKAVLTFKVEKTDSKGYTKKNTGAIIANAKNARSEPNASGKAISKESRKASISPTKTACMQNSPKTPRMPGE